MTDLTQALWTRYRSSSDPSARRQLLDRYLGLVHHCAHQLARRVSRDVELDDLIGAGTVGLVQALEGFDPGRGLAFSTYAVPRIRGAMLDELRARDWMPRSVRMRSRQLNEARAALQQELGRSPAAEQIADRLGIPLDQFWRWQDEAEGRSLVAFDASPDPDGDDGRRHEAIADPEATDPSAGIESREEVDQLKAAFAHLPPKDCLVLSLYYYEQLNLKQIGEVLHVSESRVSQLRTRALQRLRDQVKALEQPR
jgi:RNA polymerase sigma factor for flagellar operon FliA